MKNKNINKEELTTNIDNKNSVEKNEVRNLEDANLESEIEENEDKNAFKTQKNAKKRPKKEKKQESFFHSWLKWPLTVLLISLLLSFLFSFSSELLLKDANIVIAIIIIVVFVILSIIGDMIGVAVTAAKIHPYTSMASRKVRGAMEAISLVKHADRVASIFADILGDICGILSGACGVCITNILILHSSNNMINVLVASLVSSTIAALIIFGKAITKKYSIIHCQKIILIFGKFLSLFHKQPKNK